jgi:glycosyltransferase involved in cell wall biosynthesis
VRALLDARAAAEPRRTGIGHYVAGLVRHMPPAAPEDTFVAWYLDVRGERGRRQPRFPAAANLEVRASRIPRRAFGAVARRLDVPRVEWLAGDADVLLATNYIPPPTRIPVLVIVVHDLAFDVLPETAPLHHGPEFRARFARWLERATRVIVPSGSARDDLVRLYGVEPDRVDVVHHGTDAHAYRAAEAASVEEARRRYGIPGAYVLFVGAIEPRKNLERLVLAFASIDTDVSLVLAGSPVEWAPQEAERLDRVIEDLPEPARRRVIRTGYVTARDKHALVSGALALAYPSLYEGFGLPVLEGFAAGVPVLTSGVSALPEVAGEAALLVDPLDQASIARGLRELVADPDLREMLAAAGMARVASFTWERCARETVHALHRALGQAG